MRTVIAIALLLSAGLANADQVEQIISVQHDSVRGATCWILNDAAISCLPDSQLQRQQAGNNDDGRPTPATTPTPRSHEERLQL